MVTYAKTFLRMSAAYGRMQAETDVQPTELDAIGRSVVSLYGRIKGLEEALDLFEGRENDQPAWLTETLERFGPDRTDR